MFGRLSISRRFAKSQTSHRRTVARTRSIASMERVHLPGKANILVVANRTALSVGLQAALRTRLESGPARFTLLLPLGRSPDAERTAQHVASSLCEAGLEVSAQVANIDPLNAVLDVWNPAEFDEIIVSTLPAATSRWMRSGLPRRVEQRTGALVRHVEAREAPRGLVKTPAGSHAVI
jgi:hypothetical protein